MLSLACGGHWNRLLLFEDIHQIIVYTRAVIVKCIIHYLFNDISVCAYIQLYLNSVQFHERSNGLHDAYAIMQPMHPCPYQCPLSIVPIHCPCPYPPIHSPYPCPATRALLHVAPTRGLYHRSSFYCRFEHLKMFPSLTWQCVRVAYFAYR